MRSTNLKVALKMSKLSVPEKINKARNVHDAVITNLSLFGNPSQLLSAVDAATNQLEDAWHNAQDGGKSLTALMHVKEHALMKLMNDLANYVESFCDNNEELVYMAKLDIKKPASVNRPEFEVIQLDHQGAVGLRVKPRSKIIYKWQYCLDPIAANAWVTAKSTNVANAEIENLSVGELYWFRVVFISTSGEEAHAPISLAVN
jgi:hypothetical protein